MKISTLADRGKLEEISQLLDSQEDPSVFKIPPSHLNAIIEREEQIKGHEVASNEKVGRKTISLF